MAGTITSVEVQARNPGRVNVHLDGEYAFPLSMEVAVQAGLARGMVLSDERISELTNEDAWQKTYDATLNFLSFRPRSEDEVRRYLDRRKTPPDLSERVVARLKNSKLLDDEAFARFWVENRQAFNPRSSCALRSELRSKGLDDSVIAGAIAGDDAEAAYGAGLRKVRSLAAADRETFRRKLLPYLQRRGFSYETARETVDRLWREQSNTDT